MRTPFEIEWRRFRRFRREVIDPAIVVGARPLAVEVFASGAAVSFAAAREGARTAVAVGHLWGPKWSTAWFHLAGEVPAAPGGAAGLEAVLRFSSGTEALVYDAEGRSVQGLDVNRDLVAVAALGAEPTGGARVEAWVEAACNHPFGVSAFEWDDVEVHRRWASETPGVLERAEVGWLDPVVRELSIAFEFLTALLEARAGEPAIAAALVARLEAVIAAVDEADVRGTAPAALARLRDGLPRASGGASRVHAVGHAHLDTAWLWPIAETRRKIRRTLRNTLALMARHPEYRFVCSQPCQLAFVEVDDPALFDAVRARVAEGRIEPIGGMWVEPDVNVPSGEALIRQMLVGTAWFEERFGEPGRQRVLYLPDTFGFPASLPGIMAHGGLDVFITNKLHWNGQTVFPHTTFRWEGIDGSTVLGHLTPGADYNSANTPRELRRGEERARPLGDLPPRWLQPFGYGDGGGGPTEETIVRAKLAADLDGAPRVELSSMREFLDALEGDVASCRARGYEVPTWRGELYLEFHRGTLTTLGALKRANLDAEEGLRSMEIQVVDALLCGVPRDADLDAELERRWRTVLTHQFHDILPGTSIARVHREALDEHRALHPRLRREGGDLSWPLASHVPLGVPNAVFGERMPERAFVVFNAGSAPRTEVVRSTDDRSLLIRDVPALGLVAFDPRTVAPPDVPVEVSARRLANEHLEVEIDDAGRIARLVHRGTGRAVAPAGAPLNQLVLYRDRPPMWDAGDLDPDYERHATPIEDAASSIRVETRGPVAAADPCVGEVVVRRPIGAASEIVQTYRLAAGSRRLDVLTHVEWRERHTLLRALFPLDVRADHATYGVQMGAVTRPTHRNTEFDAARFEVCAHGWSDLSEPGFGVALLDVGKYGRSCLGSTMGLSLLRSSTAPDPEADQGHHDFTYSLYPHEGDWRAAGVDLEAEALRRPLAIVEVGRDVAGASDPPPSYAPLSFAPLALSCEGSASVLVSALKPAHRRAATDAEDARAVVLRLHESHGGRGRVTVEWCRDMASVVAVDAHERAVAAPEVRHAGRSTSFDVRPFQIVALKAIPSPATKE